MIFRRLAAVLLVVSPIALLAGCSNDDNNDNNVTLADLADTWTAQSFIYTSDTNPATSVDLVDDANATFVLAVEGDGNYQFTSNIPGSATDVESGDVTVLSNGQIQFDPNDEPPQTADATLSNSGNRLTLVFDEAAFDFNNDGDLEPANATLVLNRQ